MALDIMDTINKYGLNPVLQHNEHTSEEGEEQILIKNPKKIIYELIKDR